MNKTITSIFMVPTLGIDRESNKKNGFLNAYIADKNSKKKYEDCIFLLFRPKYFSRFRKFVNDEYNRTRSLIDDYDYSNGFVVLVYRLNQKYAMDFELIKQSKYSKTSDEFKDIFPKWIKVTRDNNTLNELTLQYRIFNKTADLVSYWEKINLFKFKIGGEIWHDFKEKNEVLNQSVLENILFNSFLED